MEIVLVNDSAKILIGELPINTWGNF